MLLLAEISVHFFQLVVLILCSRIQYYRYMHENWYVCSQVIVLSTCHSKKFVS